MTRGGEWAKAEKTYTQLFQYVITFTQHVKGLKRRWYCTSGSCTPVFPLGCSVCSTVIRGDGNWCLRNYGWSWWFDAEQRDSSHVPTEGGWQPVRKTETRWGNVCTGCDWLVLGPPWLNCHKLILKKTTTWCVICRDLIKSRDGER